MRWKAGMRLVRHSILQQPTADTANDRHDGKHFHRGGTIREGRGLAGGRAKFRQGDGAAAEKDPVHEGAQQ